MKIMKITTHRSPYKSFDAFKLIGVIYTGVSGEKVEATIDVHANRKSEAIEKAISRVDDLIQHLELSKEQLSEV